MNKLLIRISKMKRASLCFVSLFILSSSFCYSQDTLVLKNGNKMNCRIISVDPDIIYSIPPSDIQNKLSPSKVSYIKYHDGSMYTISSSAKDTVNHKWTPYLILSGGYSKPWTFSGYGANSYYSSYDGYGYSGYALQGNDISSTIGIRNYRGWELTGEFSYIRNQFDASGIMSETVSNFFLNNNNSIYVYYVNAIGNYYYTNYSLLGGITKNWALDKNISMGLSMLFGDFFTYTPALHGLATGVDPNNGSIPETCYFNMDSRTQNNFAAGFSFRFEVNITKHIFIRLLGEIMMSKLINTGGYQFVDITTGNTISSGVYTGGTLGFNTNSFFVGISNATAGLGYKL